MFQKNRVLAAMALMALVTWSVGCIVKEELQPPPEKPEILETEVIADRLLERAAQEPEVGKFIAENPDYPYAITVLHPDNITQLSKKYPVIYGNVPNKTLYQIDYTNNGRGMLVIVDLEDKAVVRYFRTAGVNLE